LLEDNYKKSHLGSAQKDAVWIFEIDLMLKENCMFTIQTSYMIEVRK
jgi:hypothetical protein